MPIVEGSNQMFEIKVKQTRNGLKCMITQLEGSTPGLQCKNGNEDISVLVLQ